MRKDKNRMMYRNGYGQSRLRRPLFSSNVSVRASNKSTANSPVKPSAPVGPARMVLAVPDDPARGHWGDSNRIAPGLVPVLRDELTAVVAKQQYPRERLPSNIRSLFSTASVDRVGTRTEGMTLIEIIAVLAVIGLTASGIGLSITAVNRTELKSSCNRILSAARYAYNRATINGTTVRIIFNIPGGDFSLQETNKKIVLARQNDAQLANSKDADANRGVDVDPWASAKTRLNDSFKPNLGTSAFGPLVGQNGTPLIRYALIPLGRNSKITKLIVAHEPEPRVQGQGAIYFFPGGVTEHAVIQLSQGSDVVYAVEIHPLTGHGKVYNYAYEPVALLGSPDNEPVSEVDVR
jgi:general secretion pathway protein H